MIEISILDTKSANFHSVKKAVDKYNPKNEITSNIDTIEKSNGLHRAWIIKGRYNCKCYKYSENNYRK